MSLVKTTINTLGRRTNSAVNQSQILDVINLNGKHEVFIQVDKRFSRVELIFNGCGININTYGIGVQFSVNGGSSYAIAGYRQHHTLMGVGLGVQWFVEPVIPWILLTDVNGLSNAALENFTGSLVVYSPTSAIHKMIDYRSTHKYAGNVELQLEGICAFQNNSQITNIRIFTGAIGTDIFNKGTITLIGYP